MLKGALFKLPELEKMLVTLDERAGQQQQQQQHEQHGGTARKKTGVARAKSASGTKHSGSSTPPIELEPSEQVAASSVADESRAEGSSDGVIFVHFIPPPLRKEGKSHLPWIVHSMCNGVEGCREATHVSFHSITGFSTYEGEPPEKAEGRCCACAIANHHLRGYGKVRWNGEKAVVEDDECVTGQVNGHVYMQKAKKVNKELTKAKEQIKALQQQLAAKGEPEPVANACEYSA